MAEARRRRRLATVAALQEKNLVPSPRRHPVYLGPASSNIPSLQQNQFQRDPFPIITRDEEEEEESFAGGSQQSLIRSKVKSRAKQKQKKNHHRSRLPTAISIWGSKNRISKSSSAYSKKGQQQQHRYSWDNSILQTAAAVVVPTGDESNSTAETTTSGFSSQPWQQSTTIAPYNLQDDDLLQGVSHHEMNRRIMRSSVYQSPPIVTPPSPNRDASLLDSIYGESSPVRQQTPYSPASNASRATTYSKSTPRTFAVLNKLRQATVSPQRISNRLKSNRRRGTTARRIRFVDENDTHSPPSSPRLSPYPLQSILRTTGRFSGAPCAAFVPPSLYQQQQWLSESSLRFPDPPLLVQDMEDDTTTVQSAVAFIETVASIVLQTAVRRWLAVTDYTMQCILRKLAATQIQAAVRGYLWRRVLWEYYSSRQQEQQQNATRQEAKQHHHQRMMVMMYHGAAVLIQSTFRGYWVRDCLEVDHYCAMIIQGAWRRVRRARRRRATRRRTMRRSYQ